MSKEKFCHYCFEPLVKREGESESNFEDRNTCNKVCGGKLGAERSKKKRVIRATSKLGVTFGAGFKKRTKA